MRGSASKNEKLEIKSGKLLDLPVHSGLHDKWVLRSGDCVVDFENKILKKNKLS